MNQASAGLAEDVAAQNVCGTDNVADAAWVLQMALKCMQEHNMSSCRFHAEAVKCNMKGHCSSIPGNIMAPMTANMQYRYCSVNCVKIGSAG